MANDTNPAALTGRRLVYLVAYNVVLTIVMALLLYGTILKAAKAETAAMASKNKPAKAVTTVTTTVDSTKGKDSIVTVTANTTLDTTAATAATVAPATSGAPEPYIPDMIAYVLWAISLAGGLGGALSNLRGMFEFARDNNYFPSYLEMPFYIRPISGVICGLFTFFLGTFFAGALAQGSGWKTLEGMFPYIGIAFIAGYASQEFMERLKETAKTLFGVPTTSAPPPSDNDGGGDSQPAQENPANDGHESFKPANEGGFESFPSKSGPPPVTEKSAPPPPVITKKTITPPPGRRAD